MNLDNILRTMNEYLSDMFNMFGGESMEYSTAVRQVRENIADDVLSQVARTGADYESDSPTEPLQFSRGKAAQNILSNFQTDLAQLRKEQRETGTAKTQAQRYYTEQKLDEPDTPADLKRVKEQAAARYDFNNNVNDWYDDIVNSQELTEAEIDDIKEEYSTLNTDYSDPDKRDIIRSKTQKLLDKIEKKRKNKDENTEPSAPIQGVGADLSILT